MFIKSYKSVSVRIVIMFVLVLAAFGAYPARAQAINFGWVQGGGGEYLDYGVAIALDDIGNVYTTGFVSNGLNNTDIFVQKLDGNGTLVWSKAIAGPDYDYSRSITLDGDGNVYIAGSYSATVDFDPGTGTSNLTSLGSSDTFVSKLDGNGNFLWAKSIGGVSEDSASRVAVDDSGNIYLAGYYSGTVDFDPGAGTSSLSSAGEADVFISKFDGSGNFLWAKSIGGTSDDRGFGMAVDESGSIFVTGRYSGTIDADPGVGTVYLSSVGDADIFFIRLDSSGNFVWARSFGGGSFDNGIEVALGGSGNVYVVGSVSLGSHDIFISKLDGGGNFIWSQAVGGTGFDAGYGIAVDDDENIYITGEFADTVDFDPTSGTSNLTSAGYGDIFISKLDSNANLIWVERLGGTSNDLADGIVVDSGGNLYLTGIFSDTVDFDPGTGTNSLTSAGSGDAFTSKLAVPPPAPSNVLYVKGDATGVPHDGSSWENAFIDLQSALTAASSGKEIWVAAGTYKPTGAGRTGTFLLKNGVAVYGGFAGGETARDQRDPAANLTILSGDIDNNDSQTPIITDLTTVTGNVTNSYHVVTGVTGGTLDGFVITAGYANYSFPHNTGGGMYNSAAVPVLANLTFSGNLATNSGGGMRNDTGSSPTLTNVTFSGNSAPYGGGIDNVTNSNPILTNVTFSGNRAPGEDGYGGGMENYNSHPVLTNVIFSNNLAAYGGGMMNRNGSHPALIDVTFVDNSSSVQAGGMSNVTNSSPTLMNVTFSGNSSKNGGGMRNYNNSNPALTNVTFSGNTATGDGGAMENNSNSSPLLTNVTFSGNHADGRGGAIYSYGGSPVLRNTILWGNNAPAGAQMLNNSSTSSLSDSVVQDGCPAGSTCTNILITDPRLDALGDYGGNTQTIPLMYGSSAIDAGNDGTCAVADQRGVSRPQGAHCDIGAYEAAPHIPVTFTVTKTNDTDDGVCNDDCSLREAITAAGDGDVIHFAVSGTIALGSALPAIDKTLNIDGIGQNVILDGNDQYRIFTVTSIGDLTVNHLTLQNGASNTPCRSDITPSCGGSFYSEGTLTVSNSTFLNNSAQMGGAIFVYSGSADIVSTTFSDNSAMYGGGLFNQTGNVHIVTSTFSGNSTTAGGGGGGVFNYAGLLTLTSSTLAGNSAMLGGNVYNAGDLNFTNTILADSTSGDDCYNANGIGEISIDINNLIETNSAAPNHCGTPALSEDPALDPLASNGGPTQTMALRLGSPALNAGDDATCTGVDQRGVARPQDTHCDIGSYEHQNPRPTVVKNTHSSGAGSLNQAINDAVSGDTITFENTLSGATIYLSNKSITKNITIDASSLSVPVTLNGQQSSRLFQVSEGARLELKNLILINGSYNGLGGTIDNKGTLNLTRSVISNSRANSWGGAIYNEGDLTIVDSTFSNNSSSQADGGAISNWSDGIVTIHNSTFNNNSGAAIHSYAVLTVTNSTFTGNAIGIYSSATLDVKNSTFAGNSIYGIQANANYSTGTNTGILRVENTILANNGSRDCYNNGAIVQSFVNNLVEVGTCGTPVVSADPQLGALADNGGPTRTMSLQPSSPAIDAGSDASCLAIDQRRVARPQGSHCDIGAFEYVDTIPPTVVSSIRQNGNPSNRATVFFLVTFSESVDGVNAADFTLITTGEVTGASITSVSGSGAARTVAVNTGTGSGTLRLDVVDDDTIVDAEGNPLDGGFVTGEEYTLDKTAPIVVSSVRQNGSPSNRATVFFLVTFSEVVSGVGTADFALTTTGDLTGASIASVTGSGATRMVSVNTGTGSGTLHLDVVDDDTIKDAPGNSLNGGFVAGQEYIIEKTPPAVVSSARLNGNPSNRATIFFLVTFSEAVTGVNTADFTLTTTGDLAGASIAGVTGSGSTRTVTVNTGTGSGTLRLDVVDDDTIKDAIGNALGGVGADNGNFITGQNYDMDKMAPTVVSSVRLNGNPSSRSSVFFLVTFSESVTGVNTADFTLTTTGDITGASIVSVTGSGTTRTVSINTGSGSGTIRLDVVDDDTIKDASGNPLSGTANGSFTAGQSYTLVR